jgi:hypothetical protein
MPYLMLSEGRRGCGSASKVGLKATDAKMRSTSPFYSDGFSNKRSFACVRARVSHLPRAILKNVLTLKGCHKSLLNMAIYKCL